LDTPLLFGLNGWHLLTLVAFAATLAAVFAAGLHKPEALARGPVRDVGWSPADLFAGLGLFVLGPLLASFIPPALGVELTAEGGAAAPVTTRAAVGALVQTVAWLPAAVYLVVRLARAGHLRLGGVIPRRPMRDLGVAAVGIVVAFVLATGLGTVLQFAMTLMQQPLPEHGHVIFETLADNDSALLVFWLLVAAVVIAPIGEEVFFRGLMQTGLQAVIGHERRWLSILPCAVFFGVVHIGAVPGFMVPVLVLLGVVFGWVYERTGSLWCAIAVHAGFNALSFTLALLTIQPTAGGVAAQAWRALAGG
jgi:hypothetical protein